MDVRDVIIIKFIIIYYCLSAFSIPKYGEAIAHAQTACPKLKPHLLLSNSCHVEYFDLDLFLSLNSWLTKSQVLFVVREGILCLGLTSAESAGTLDGL